MSLAENKRAYFDYEILEEIEAGVELRGQEVKSVRAGRMNIVGGHAIIRGGEVYLVGVDIPPYQVNNISEEYDQERTRRLLLSKKEIKKLMDILATKGLTLLPLKVYNKGGLIKILLGVVRHKKTHDKRATLKERAVKREINQTLKKSK